MEELSNKLDTIISLLKQIVDEESKPIKSIDDMSAYIFVRDYCSKSGISRLTTALAARPDVTVKHLYKKPDFFRLRLKGVGRISLKLFKEEVDEFKSKHKYEDFWT